jgi:phosphoribosylformylglycinamidine (FGAM) synthase PurS component
MIKKELLPTNDLYIQFTEEELKELDMNPGDKFDVKLQDDGSIKLSKYIKMELETADWPREFLELLIKESCEKDISVNTVICDILKEHLNEK